MHMITVSVTVSLIKIQLLMILKKGFVNRIREKLKKKKKKRFSETGWVVTWFLLGYTVRMFEYTVRTF